MNQYKNAISTIILIFTVISYYGCSSREVEESYREIGESYREIEESHEYQRLTKQLKSEDPVLRENALLAISDIGSQGRMFLDPVREAISDSVPYVRGTAIWAYYSIIDSFHAGALFPWHGTIQHKPPDITKEYKHSENSPITFLFNEMRSDEPRQVLSALVLLAEIGYLENTDTPPDIYDFDNIRSSYLTSYKFKEDELTLLLGHLKNEDPRIRLLAAIAIDSFLDSALAVPALIDALDDSNNLVRRRALYSLSRFGGKAEEAVDKIATILERTDDSVSK